MLPENSLPAGACPPLFVPIKAFAVKTSLPPTAHKNGEVVGPAGGGTGGPHCLAEVHKLLAATLHRQL